MEFWILKNGSICIFLTQKFCDFTATRLENYLEIAVANISTFTALKVIINHTHMTKMWYEADLGSKVFHCRAHKSIAGSHLTSSFGSSLKSFKSARVSPVGGYWYQKPDVTQRLIK